MTTSDYERSRFLNVDLDIYGATNLKRLVTAFGDRVDVLYVGREGAQFSAHLEVSGSGIGGTADRLIIRLAKLVRELPASPRGLWDSAVSRDFNIGIQAGIGPPSSRVASPSRNVAGCPRNRSGRSHYGLSTLQALQASGPASNILHGPLSVRNQA